MSSYFDKHIAGIKYYSDRSNFLEEAQAIEDEVIHEINLVTGDKFFPSDLRDKIQGAIAVWAILGSGDKGKERFGIMQKSYLLDELHQLFHELAQRRIEAPYGPLNDNPADILKRRGL